MPEQIINNYEVARELDSFNLLYIISISNRITEANKVLMDKNRVWKNNSLNEAKMALNEMESKLINFKRLYNAFYKLMHQHEKLTSRLFDIYNNWYTNVAYEGKQPVEMMGSQADVLQGIFSEIYNFIEPIVKNELKAPNHEN
jgi:hypothetical protein